MYRRSINSAVKLAVQIANKNHHWLEKTDWKFHKSTHNIKMSLFLHSFTKINSLQVINNIYNSNSLTVFSMKSLSSHIVVSLDCTGSHKLHTE